MIMKEKLYWKCVWGSGLSKKTFYVRATSSFEAWRAVLKDCNSKISPEKMAYNNSATNIRMLDGK